MPVEFTAERGVLTRVSIKNPPNIFLRIPTGIPPTIRPALTLAIPPGISLKNLLGVLPESSNGINSGIPTRVST